MINYRILMAFLIPGEQEKVEGAQKKRDVEGMGVPEIKYGESMCFMQHLSTGLWLTYAALDAKAARLGTMKRRVWSKPHDHSVYQPVYWCQAFKTLVFLMILHLNKLFLYLSLRPYYIKRAIWMMHWPALALRWKSLRLLVWSTAPRAFLHSLSSTTVHHTQFNVHLYCILYCHWILCNTLQA